MKKTICVLLALLMTVLPLAGCSQPEQEPEPVSSLAWEVPQLNYGVLEYEKLSVLPWYSGRTEATSFNTFADSCSSFISSNVGITLNAPFFVVIKAAAALANASISFKTFVDSASNP